MSIEREVFPEMAKDGTLFVMPLEGIWMDIGTPKAFVDCIPLFLQNKDKVLIDPSAQVGEGCLIGPNVVIGRNVVIGDHSCIENSVVMDGSRVGCAALIKDSIVGWNCNIGKWARLLEETVLGEDVTVRDGLVMRTVIVCPHKVIDRSYFEPEKII
jgi:mannose-1-phosphate guanylyltransferase